MALDAVDVLIVGAGLSGVGAACHLRRKCKGKSLAILEARDTLGGTWDLFRYPGIRSDSDMFTLGYAFRPWVAPKAIAEGEDILRYIRDTARDYDVERLIRYRHRAVAARWSSVDACWTVRIERVGSGEHTTMRCRFLYICSGYYRYDAGYTPEFADRERFAGSIVHPQDWPEDLDYRGKRVVIIGSGATAITLAPAMAAQADHVTILQRSPTYVVSRPAKDALAEHVRWLPDKAAYAVVRFKNVLLTTLFYQFSRRFPRAAKARIAQAAKAALPAGYDVETHFNPRYDPWDQRICLVPEGDLFRAIRAGRVSIVTDRIERFTEEGIRLESGATLQADVIVTATGLRLLVNGGLRLNVDGTDIAYPQTVSYKGMMLSGVPNLAYATGYTNASWTLKADLVSDYVCRLLNFMDAQGYAQCMPEAPDPSLPREPTMQLRSGYILRSLHDLPQQASRVPWRIHQNYIRDLFLFRLRPLRDRGLRFSRASSPSRSVRSGAGAEGDSLHPA